jgi:hypothetical protein
MREMMAAAPMRGYGDIYQAVFFPYSYGDYRRVGGSMRPAVTAANVGGTKMRP